MIKIKHASEWFDVRLLDGFKIYGLKIKLKFIRLGRRVKLLCDINKLTLMLLPAWFAFLLLTWLWGKATEITPSFMDLLWEYRTDFLQVLLLFYLQAQQLELTNTKTLSGLDGSIIMS